MTSTLPTKKFHREYRLPLEAASEPLRESSEALLNDPVAAMPLAFSSLSLHHD